jgi:polyhydroxybutyrate depolymerase
MRSYLHWVGFACVLACSSGSSDKVKDTTSPSSDGDSGTPAAGDGDQESPDGPSAGDGDDSPPPGDGDGTDEGPDGNQDAAPPENPPEEPEAPCGELAWAKGQSTTVELEHGGVKRSYVAYVGKDVDASARVPLLVNIHGLNNSPALQAAFSQMNPQADKRNLIVVYPQGIQASFNAGTCCGPAQQQGVDDLGFMRAVVDDAKSKACVDRKRVYAAGFSNGGFMVNTLACAASDVFAAVAAVGGANGALSCEPGRAVPFFGLNAPPDTIVDFNGGHENTLDWVTRNGCNETPERTEYSPSYCELYSGCTDDVQVEFCTWVNGFHYWPSSPLAASDLIWEFFDRFTLP